MDKVELSVQDIEALLNWRDQHQDEVRSHPAPLKAVEIVMPHNGYHIKGVRDGDQLRLHLSQSGEQLGNCRFIRRAGGMWASTRNRMKVGRDDLQAVLTVYCSVMALMAYGRREPEPREALAPKPKSSPSKRPTKRKSKRTTYILRSINGALSAVPRGGPCESPGHLHCPGPLPALQERESGLGLGVQEGDREDAEKNLQGRQERRKEQIR